MGCASSVAGEGEVVSLGRGHIGCLVVARGDDIWSRSDAEVWKLIVLKSRLHGAGTDGGSGRCWAQKDVARWGVVEG